MGREFIGMFDEWADHYDHTVSGEDEQYKEVFSNYELILDEVTKRSGNVVLEFGCGTGNLTKKLIDAKKEVYCIEPSPMMSKKAKEKLGDKVMIDDGDFLTFPIPEKNVDTMVSTYAFHHLTDTEKEKAVSIYGSLLKSGGKIVFADTAFIDQEAKNEMIQKAMNQKFNRLAMDLQTEYYTTHSVLRNMFEKNHFRVSFTKMNSFVWLIEAVKQ